MIWEHLFMRRPFQPSYVCYPESVGHFAEAPHHVCERQSGQFGYYNLHLIFNGEGWLDYRGKRYTLREGEGFLYRPGAAQQYGAAAANPWDIHWVHYEAMPWAELLRDGEDVWLFSFTAVDKLKRLFEQLKEACKESTKEDEAHISALLYELLLTIREHGVGLDNPLLRSAQERIRAAAELIRTRCVEPLTIAELAESSGYSTAHFCRLFRQTTGKTPVEFLTESRVTEAKRMLLSTSRPVKQIAIEAGFGQSSYFIRKFREAEGMTPDQYRRLFDSGR
ncbi:hypothetical protein PCCS19_35410 [Paenibacillus sp. CCS19]|uniref:AraC family transcriptional regulator n=1 Tax=Paenibacillus sp. CCS19 TaxID=3158387 RepID=UPI002565FD13|nr:AraC family transcriptional regulator [Paenibacillus cellulosilyticus]GMK40485.1 hypothetical protein PCCS19_35410 [Paenibacillus cellulosilyticus]